MLPWLWQRVKHKAIYLKSHEGGTDCYGGSYPDRHNAAHDPSLPVPTDRPPRRAIANTLRDRSRRPVWKGAPGGPKNGAPHGFPEPAREQFKNRARLTTGATSGLSARHALNSAAIQPSRLHGCSTGTARSPRVGRRLIQLESKRWQTDRPCCVAARHPVDFLHSVSKRPPMHLRTFALSIAISCVLSVTACDAGFLVSAQTGTRSKLDVGVFDGGSVFNIRASGIISLRGE